MKPQAITEAASAATQNLLPPKFRKLYNALDYSVPRKTYKLTARTTCWCISTKKPRIINSLRYERNSDGYQAKKLNVLTNFLVGSK